MATADIIELGSSDEEPGPPPPKKINVSNAMVHIPSNLRGVTIKPVKTNLSQLPKLGKNITITKTSGSVPDKTNQRLATPKKKVVGKKINHPHSSKGKIFNPLALPSNCTVTTLKNPIQIKKSQLTSSKPLQGLPPSITIKKTGAGGKPAPPQGVLTMPQKRIIPKTMLPNAIVRKTNLPKIILPKTILAKTMPKQQTNLRKKRKLEVMQTVELDDDDATTSSKSPQWYMRPEEQSEKVSQEDKAETLPEPPSQEDANNKEPEVPNYIEITIEDSPIKPAKLKRTRELSIEKVITIDDSPNKGSVISDDPEGSDGELGEAKKVKKIPQSKKKLDYPKNLQAIQETHTFEIEIEPINAMDPLNTIELDVPNPQANNESKIISLTPEIMEAEEASVEIAQNKQGTVSVVQIKPQTKQNTKVDTTKKAPKIDVGMPSEFHPIYQSFISLCIKLENSNDMEKIIEKKIKPYYRQVSKEYTESEEFLDMVSSKITAMEAAPEKMYLFIKDIVDELNLQRKYMKQVPEEVSKSKDQDSFLYGKENELDPNKKRQIRKLEKTLKKLNRAIQKLEAQEVDFDDEEDSVYLLTEKYKERMVRVHAKFCQLTNTKLPSQPRLVIDPRPGLSAAPAKRLEAWINKKNTVSFPDFHDVLRCVREANEVEKLGWNEAFIMEEARDLFVRCGKKLQRRRQENEWRLAISRISANSDPAEQNDELRNELEANRRLASTKESEVFNKFCDKQSQMKLEAVEIDDKEAEESPVESEEEDHDDDSSLESKQRRKDRLRRLLQEQSKRNTPNQEHVDNEEESVKEPAMDMPENKTENDEEKIQTLSDDSNEIGSDMDELHLLQKLHSDCEIRTVSSSSDSETPIAISDNLDSSSDSERQTQHQPTDVISIENSSYSDESGAETSDALKENKRYTVASGDLMEENKEIECSSLSVIKNTHTTDVTIENAVLSLSDDGSNLDDNTNSGKSDDSSKVPSLTIGQVYVKDCELGNTSERGEIGISIHNAAKPSDAEDESSVNSDMIDNPVSSASSGQYEELLKEHNADPLLKRPDLVPRDPSDELFDSLEIKHYNDPLVKKKLEGSDSSNGDDPENSNSDTQSTVATVTLEEARKDLIETSVDTEEFLNLNSPSVEIVDKLIDKLKQSDGSQSSDDLLMKIDREIQLNTEVPSPVTLELEKAVRLARKTKAWPRFKDECSSVSSADENNTDQKEDFDERPQSEVSKGLEVNETESNSNESTNNSKEVDNASPKINSASACSYKSGKEDYDERPQSEVSKGLEVNETESNSNESTNTSKEVDNASPKINSASACSYKSGKDSLEEMEVEHDELASTENSKDSSVSNSECTKDGPAKMDVSDIELDSTEESKSLDTCISNSTNKLPENVNPAFHEVSKDIVCNSEASKGVSKGITDTEIKKASSYESKSDILEIMDFIEERETEQPKEIGNEVLVTSVVSVPNTDDTGEASKDHCNMNTDKCDLAQEDSGVVDDTVMEILNCNSENEINNGSGSGSDIINNGSLNINMDITDLLDSDTELDPKLGHDIDLNDINKLQSTEIETDEKAESITNSSVCLQSTKGNN